MDLTSTFAPITKTVDQDDGSLLVYGKATDDSLDLDEQRCDATWLKTAMPEWFQWGNIREQHRKDSAVGKAIDHEDAQDGHYITAKIVDPVAVAKTRAGIFTGFSIGIMRPKIVKSPTARNGLINGGIISEISLVDRPANSNAILTLCKSAKTGWEGSAADLDQERGLVKCEELLIDEEGLAKALQVSITKGVDEVEAAKGSGPLDVATMEGCGCCDKCTVPGCGCCAMCPADPLADGAIKSFPVTSAPEFDREKAIELVKAANPETQANVLAGITVPPTAPPPEMDDILHAKAAIALIGQLIQAEAMNLATRPYEDCDILLLMQAVQSLREFICREKMQPGNENADVSAAVASLTSSLKNTDPDLLKGKYSAEQLRSMLSDGKAMKNPNGDPSYPIGDKEDLANAIHAVGRGSGDHDSIRAYIKRRASALGASSMIPDNWSSSGSNKAADSDVVVDTKEKTMDVENGDVVEKSAPEVLVPVDAPLTEEKVDEIGKALEGADPVDEPITKSADADTETPTEEPDVTKAAGAGVDAETLIKAFKDSLVDENSELRKMFVDITEASTKSAVKALSDELGARLEKVEQMATPGGPPLRRTEVERVNARKTDLEREVMRYKGMASAAEDPDLRKGYLQKALQIGAELKSL
jgi:hypothetical protein